MRYHKEIEESSLALRYIDHNAKLEAGVDFSAMCSVVTAQPRGNYLYCLKEFHTLAPANEIQLGKKIREFYKYPKDKALDRYYDRSENQNSKTKRDWANALKNAIAFENGVATGWTINLMSLNQATIYQEEEFAFELRTRDRERKLINKIGVSIEKVKQDDYGWCDSCGDEIGVKRLEARPTATHCIHCKTLDEIKEKQLNG